MSSSFQDLANFIWSVADLLRGPYRPPQYERVMLPMTVLRRFDCILEPTKAAVVQLIQGLVPHTDLNLSLSRLKERSSALITAAVTGQLDREVLAT